MAENGRGMDTTTVEGHPIGKTIVRSINRAGSKQQRAEIRKARKKMERTREVPSVPLLHPHGVRVDLLVELVEEADGLYHHRVHLVRREFELVPRQGVAESEPHGGKVRARDPGRAAVVRRLPPPPSPAHELVEVAAYTPKQLVGLGIACEGARQSRERLLDSRDHGFVEYREAVPPTALLQLFLQNNKILKKQKGALQ